MKKLILALKPLPNNKKDNLSQFYCECENIKDGISILNKLHPNKYEVIGCSKYMYDESEWVNNSFT